MAATVYYQGAAEIATIINTFAISGTPADPTTVSLVLTDPSGVVVTHTYLGTAPADITKTSTGVYQLNVSCTLAGMWSYVWIGTGTVSDIVAGTFTVTDTTLNRLYASKEEVKNRMGLAATDTADDDQILLACQAAARGIDKFTHRYFWQGTDTRFFRSTDIEMLNVDDLVSVTQLAVDQTGMRVYDQIWATADYILEPVNAPGFNPEPRPYTQIRAQAAGGGHFWWPWIFPLSNPWRVKIQGVFGWPAVPYLVKQAALVLAEDIYKLKDAPFGVLGSAELGIIRIRQNPQVEEMLWHYVRGSSKVGV